MKRFSISMFIATWTVVCVSSGSSQQTNTKPPEVVKPDRKTGDDKKVGTKKKVDLFTMIPKKPTFGQAIGVTAMTFGADRKKEPEYVLFTGILEISESPHVEKLATGLRRVAVRFDSNIGETKVLAARAATGTSIGDVEIWVDPDKPHDKSFLTEELDTKGTTLSGHSELFLVFKMSPDLIVKNKDPVILKSHIHNLPPIHSPVKLRKNMTAPELIKLMKDAGEVDSWEGANLPVDLLDDAGKVRAIFTPRMHKTMLTGEVGDRVDNDLDGQIDEEIPLNHIDDDKDGFIDEDCKWDEKFLGKKP